MHDIAVGALLLGAAVAWAAWAERRAHNRRDASLLAAVAAGSSLSGLGLLLL